MPQLRAFGPLSLVGAAGEVGLGGPKQRAVLAVLLAERGRLVSTDRLVDEVWGEDPPAAGRQSVQSYVSNLRRLLDGAVVIEGSGSGYVCRIRPGALDLDHFDDLLARARSARNGDDAEAVSEAYRAALATATAPPFEGFEDVPSVMVEATRVESLRLTAVEEHLDVEMGRGKGPELVAELESLVARHPLREQLWGHLMIGLYQAGRQADALRCYQRARRLLASEMGIEPSPELVGLERRILDHDPALALGRTAPASPPATTCPYKGLAPYQPEDAPLFCGRQVLVDRLVALAGSAHFAAAVGASGSGKSSLLRAGLVPALTGDGRWPVALFTPGADPFTELARRLSPGAASTATTELAAEPGRHPGALHRVATDLLARAPAGARLLIVVDQLEEVFTLCEDPRTRTAFAAALAEAATRPDSRVSVAVAVRADFYGRCAELAPLIDLLARHHVLVGPMTAADLRAAVVEPAARAGLRVEDGLVDDLVSEARDEPGALPLLSHALLETWLRREGTSLTRAGYADAGGLSGAIARTAQAVVGERLDATERATVRAVLLDLVHPGTDGAPDTSRPVRRRDLRASGPVDAVVEKLTAARLLTRDGDVVALAHEALITGWPELQSWLAEEREDLVEQRRLSEAAAEWERLGREPSAVFRGPRLAAAAQLVAGDREVHAARERDFVDAGLTQERAAARRRRGLVTGLAVLAAVATLAATFALDGRGEARREARVATSRRLAAQSALALGRNDRAPALLLAVEALRASDTLEARSALGEALVTPVDAASVLLGHEGDVRSVAVTADGTSAASAGIDGKVRVWDLSRAEERHVFGPFGGEQRDVVFRPDGKALAAVGIDGVVRLWDPDTGVSRQGSHYRRVPLRRPFVPAPEGEGEGEAARRRPRPERARPSPPVCEP